MTAKHAQMLVQKGHQVTVTGLGHAKPSLQERVRALKKGKIARDRLSYDQHFRDVGIIPRTLDYQDRVHAEDLPDADIVIATFWRTAEWVLELPPEKGRKVYFLQSHETFPHFPEDRVRATYLSPMHKITIADWIARVMRDEYDQHGVEVIPNSADYTIFNAPSRKKNSTPRIGFLYAHSSVKGVDIAIKAINIVREKIPDLKLVSFGSVEPTKSLPLPSDCEFHHRPPQTKIREIYASCDLWLVGSRIEGFHLPPIEAMACRTPVVSTRVGGPDDLITNGVNGFVVDIEDYHALAEKAAEVLTLDPDKWKQMSEAAYKRATSYTWEDAGKKFEAALLDIMALPHNDLS